MSTTLKNFKDKNPHGKLVHKECFLHDGVLLISEEGIGELLGVTSRQVLNLKKAGMQTHRLTSKGCQVYDVIYVIKWWENKHNKALFSQYVAPQISSGRDIEDEQIDELDRLIKVQKLKTDKLKHKELNGELIRAEDLDRGMSEQAVLHKTHYQDDLDTLPSVLANKDEKFISNFLSSHYENRLTSLQQFISKTFDIKEALYKKIMRWIADEKN